MRQGMQKNDQPASKVSPDEPKWAHLGSLLRMLEAFLATWGIHLCMFMHFYQVFVNTCAFLMKIHGKTTKTQQIALKIAQDKIIYMYPNRFYFVYYLCIPVFPLRRTRHTFLAHAQHTITLHSYTAHINPLKKLTPLNINLINPKKRVQLFIN